MHIIELRSENIKRLTAVTITPTGNLVEITGGNRQGKTSVLDSLWWALGGKDSIQKKPIRNGQKQGTIEVKLGTDKTAKLIVRRIFKLTDEGEITTSLSVESPDGAKYGSPQKMIDAFVGALTFDPLEFTRMSSKEQFDALRQFVPDVDFYEITARNRFDADQRKDLNNRARQELAAAELIAVPDGTPEEEVDEATILDELERAGEHNADVERRRKTRSDAAEQLAKQPDVIAQIDRELAIAVQQRVTQRDNAMTRIQDQIRELQRQLTFEETSADDDIAAVTERMANEKSERTQEFADLQARLEAAPPLPDPIDVAAVRARHDAARITNGNVRRLLERRQHLVRSDQAQKEADGITARIDARNEAKNKAIAAAKMPVPGITFGDDVVFLNGVPFDQASDEEQLSTSIDIAAAMNSKLRVIRVRDGSLMDSKARKVLEAKAEEKKFQVWVEKVDETGKIGFVIEDGRLQSTPESRAAEVAS